MVTSGQHNGSSQSSSSSSTGNAPSTFNTTSPRNGSDDPSGSGSPAVPPTDDVSPNHMNATENINGVVGPESRKMTTNGYRDGKVPLDPHRSTVDPPATWGNSQTAAAGQRDAANQPDPLYGGGPPVPPPAGSSNTVTRRDAALPVASSASSSRPLPPRVAHDSEKQHGSVTGPGPAQTSSKSPQSHRETTAQRPRAEQVRRTPSALSPLKSPSPALRRQSFSMSSFSPPPSAPVPTNTSERTRTPRGKASSDLRVATGGGVLPREENNGNNAKTPNNVSPFLDHTSEPDSGYNSSFSQAPPPVDRDNSRFTRNEETGDNPKGSIEKTNTVGQRRNAALDDEGNGSRPGTPGYHDAYGAQHRQTSKRGQPHNPSHRNDSRSPYAPNADESREKTHEYLPDVPQTESPPASRTVSGEPSPAPPHSASPSPPNGDPRAFSSSNLSTPGRAAGPRGTQTVTSSQPDQSGHRPAPHSHGKPRVSKQPSPHPHPGTSTRRKPSNPESTPSQKRSRWSRWSCSIGCVCNRN